MATTFTQSAVDAAVNYLMHGGPNGGELTDDQYRAMVLKNVYPGSSTEPDLRIGNPNFGLQSRLTSFAWQLQLAINQGHAGISASHNLHRDQWGTVDDVLWGVGLQEIQSLNISISG